MPARDRLLAVLVAALWGGNFLAIHIGLQDFPPLLLAALRFAAIAVPTVLLVPRPRVPLRWLIGYGLGFGTVQFAFLFVAMDNGMPAGLASLVLQASGPLTLMLGALLLREHVTPRQGVGIGCAALGLTAIVISRAQIAAVLPVLLTLLGALGWALGNLANRLAAPPNPLQFTLWMTVVPPVPLLALSLALEGPAAGAAALRSAVTPQGLPGLIALAYIVVLGTVAGSGIWTSLLRRHPAGVVAPYSLLVPVVGMTLAALVLEQQPKLAELIATVIVIGGVLLGTPAARATPRPNAPNRRSLCPSQAPAGADATTVTRPRKRP